VFNLQYWRMTRVERDVAREDSIECADVDAIDSAAVEDSIECAAVDSEIWFGQEFDEISQQANGLNPPATVGVVCGGTELPWKARERFGFG
jgi:hypothetical protein